MATAKTDHVVGVDEGLVFTGPNPDGEYKGPVEGEDRAGVYGVVGEETDDGIVLSSPQAKPAVRVKGGKAMADKPKKQFVFTNTRYPEQTIALTTENENGVRERTGYYAEFHSCKLVTDDPETARQIEALDRAYIYREPDNYFEVDPQSKQFFNHPATGFRTLVKDAYEDWVNNSEWSAVPR